MTRWLIVALAIVLLLSGCANNGSTSDEEATDAMQQTQTTVNTGLYQPQHIETDTSGAIRCFPLKKKDYYGCVKFGEDLLLLRDDEGTQISLYQGQNLEFVKSVSLGEGVTPTMEQIYINEQGLGYFDSKNRAIVFLNEDLVEIGRVYLPEDMHELAWMTPNWKTVYYCSDAGICALDLQTHISRVLYAQEALSQEVTGIFGDGKAIRYEVSLKEGKSKTLLIDTATGLVLKEGKFLNDLQTSGDHYYLPKTTWGVLQLKFGNGEENKVLWPEEKGAETHVLFPNRAAVTIQYLDDEEQNQATSLSYYDLESGLRTAKIKLEWTTKVWNLYGDGNGGVWMFAEYLNQNVLFYWDTAKSVNTEETVYTAPFYTAENPDEAGLKNTAAAAKKIAKEFGVEILIWEDAVKAAPNDQFFTGQHITQVYDKYLPKLKKLLAKFPEDFFTQTTDKKLKILLVKEISGVPAWGTLKSSTITQYWKKDVPYIALTMDRNFEKNFYHAVGLFLETQVLSHSSSYYEWFKLNPKGFTYDNSYIKNLKRKDTQYLTRKNPYFIDLFSMSYAKEDRAMIFQYACTPGNEKYFDTKILYRKMERICEGIRTAFDLEDVKTEFLWEQYLK